MQDNQKFMLVQLINGDISGVLQARYVGVDIKTGFAITEISRDMLFHAGNAYTSF